MGTGIRYHQHSTAKSSTSLSVVWNAFFCFRCFLILFVQEFYWNTSAAFSLAEEVAVKLPLWGWRNGWEATTRCNLGETTHTDWKWDCTLTDTGHKPSTCMWNHQHWWQMVQALLGRQTATWCKGPWAFIYQLTVCQEISSASVRTR